MLIDEYPDQLEAIGTPYTAKTKVVADETGLWASMKKHDVDRKPAKCKVDEDCPKDARTRDNIQKGNQGG